MTVAKLTECPPRATLEALLANQLAVDEAALVREHVGNCKTCRLLLATYGERKSAAGAAQEAAGADTRESLRSAEQPTASGSDDPSGRRSKTLGGNDPTEQLAQLSEGPPTPSRAETVAATGHFLFLAPAQASGELGRLGPYRVLRVIGQGGMGIVFEAEDLALSRRVALKCLRPDAASDSIRQRFLQEARIAASLPHDHIVTIFQVGEENNVPFLAMEYLHGESVEDRLKRDRWLSVTEALRIAREVAEGLQAAHVRGLIHRDIKPANVWLETETPHGAFKRVKLLDFGLARAIDNDDHITRHGDIVGTPSYMAPEQACGLPVDGRTDLFSLGCMLYRMLTGKSPFRGDDTYAILTALVNEQPPSAESLVPEIPPSVALLLNQLLSKDPDGRPASAQVVIQRIRAIENGDNYTSLRASLGQTRTVSMSRTALRRRRLGWGVWLGLGTIVATILIGLAVEYRRFLGFATEDNTDAVPHVAEAAAGKPLPPAAGQPAPSSAPAAPVAGLPAPLAGKPIKVGVLHSLSGTMAASESPIVDAVVLAIEEINQAGGVLGRKVEPVIVDGRSDDQAFAAGAEQLITRDKVSAIFGCWTSSSRKSVRPVVEKYENLLFFPLQNEGLEESPNIIYLGACPNQQLLPAVKYCFAFLEKRRFFLVGSDYVFPHAANAIMKDELAKLGATVVGEAYVPLGDTEISAVVKSIVEAQPDVILNTINGDSNIAFFRQLRAAGIRPDRVPTVSFSITESGLRAMSGTEIIGDYAAWCYFQSIETPTNEDFLRRFRARFGVRRVVNDPMEISYCGVYLWREGVAAAHTDEPPQARTALLGHAYDAPEGKIRVDGATQYCWRTPRIGRVTPDIEFDEVWCSPRPVAPEPFPASRTREQWESFLGALYEGWGGHWNNRAP